jgi:hypothetical protein
LHFHFIFFVGNGKPIDLFLVVAVLVQEMDVFQKVLEQLWQIIFAGIAIVCPAIAEGNVKNAPKVHPDEAHCVEVIIIHGIEQLMFLHFDADNHGLVEFPSEHFHVGGMHI